MAGELITADGQLEWRGVLLGAGTAYDTQTLVGWWDLPGQRGENVPLPDRHGSYPNPRWSEDRIILWEFAFNVDTGDLEAAAEQLRQVTAPSDTPGEETLAVRLDGVTLLATVQLTKRAIAVEHRYSLGLGAGGAVEWEAADPRLYSVDEHIATLVLAVSSPGGLDFGSGGLDFGSGGLDFGDGPQGGVASANNAGHVPTWPLLEVVGPVTGPVVMFEDSGRMLAFDPLWTVLDGQTLVIDTANRTATISGVSVRQRLFVAQWTPLYPGDNRIRFTAASYDASAQLRVRSRDAYH